MSKITIYHNPKCSKSRQTLEIIESKGIKPEIIKYLDSPPSETTLKMILSLLNLEPRELMRNGEAEYKENDMSNDSLSNSDLIALMHRHPKVIERPIVLSKGKASIGRPPESVLDIL